MQTRLVILAAEVLAVAAIRVLQHLKAKREAEEQAKQVRQATLARRAVTNHCKRRS